MPVEIGERLRISDVLRVAQERADGALSPYARERVMRSRTVVERLVREGRVISGITDGVEELAGVHISPARLP